MGCRGVRPKSELLRLGRTPDGQVRADPRGVMPGRGAYLCLDGRCLAEALKRGRFYKAFRGPVRLDQATSEEIREAIEVPEKT